MDTRSPIRKLRERYGLSQAEVAKAIKISRNSYGLIERGCAIPSVAIAQRLARYLETTVERLWPEE